MGFLKHLEVPGGAVNFHQLETPKTSHSCLKKRYELLGVDVEMPATPPEECRAFSWSGTELRLGMWSHWWPGGVHPRFFFPLR